jgi:hypothetical protein
LTVDLVVDLAEEICDIPWVAREQQAKETTVDPVALAADLEVEAPQPPERRTATLEAQGVLEKHQN